MHFDQHVVLAHGGRRNVAGAWAPPARAFGPGTAARPGTSTAPVGAERVVAGFRATRSAAHVGQLTLVRARRSRSRTSFTSVSCRSSRAAPTSGTVCG